MFYLAWRNVARRLGQATITALIVCIAVFVVTASCVVISSLETGLKLSKERLGADIMLLPAGASTSASEVLFTAQPVNVYLPESIGRDALSVEGVANATPQFFTQTLNQSCCSVVGITRVVGIDVETDFILTPWLNPGSTMDLGEDGILMGSVAPAIDGEQVSILGSVFHIRGSLDSTGTSVDETIFMDIDSARRIAAGSPYLTSVWEGIDPFTSISCVMVKVDDGVDAATVAKSLMAAFPGTIAVTTSEMVSGVSSQLSVVESISGVMLIMLVVVAALALAGRYAALTQSRQRELGLMRTLGVGRWGVASSLAFETGIVTLASALVGVSIACLASSFAVDMMHGTFNLPGAAPSMGTYLISVAIGLAFALALNAATLIQPVMKIMRSDPQETLARGDL